MTILNRMSQTRIASLLQNKSAATNIWISDPNIEKRSRYRDMDNLSLVFTFMNSINLIQQMDRTMTEPTTPEPDQYFTTSIPLLDAKIREWMAKGYSREQAEEKCRPNPYEYEEVMQGVMRLQKQALRDLAC